MQEQYTKTLIIVCKKGENTHFQGQKPCYTVMFVTSPKNTHNLDDVSN